MCLSGKEAGSFVQWHYDVSPWVQPKRGGADHRSFVRSGDVVRVVRCVERCRRQLLNDLKRSPEEVESSGLMARDGDVDSTVPGMFRLFIFARGGRRRQGTSPEVGSLEEVVDVHVPLWQRGRILRTVSS